MEIVIPANSRKEIRIDEDKNINLIIGRNCEVKIIDVSGEEVEVFVDENSVVDYITIKKDDANLNKIAVIGKNSVMNWIDCYISNKINAIVRTELIGRGSETKTISVIFGDEDNEFNVKNEVIHAAPNSKSNMLTRVVLNGRARANYNGLVRVNPNSYGCKGYQKKETILLSEDAKIDAIPNLEIENNDVKCSHGATISQIDEMKLFYMMSRGIDEKSAKKQIVEGFFDPILVKIEDDKIKEDIKNNISERLGALV